jgi:cell wall-associated NlpC family hydrolase
MVVTLGTTLLIHPSFCESQQIDNQVQIILPDRSCGFVSANDIVFDQRTVRVSQGATLAASAVLAAVRLVGVPYHFGGTTPLGIDGSGLVLLSYRMAGLSVKRNACMQFNDERFDLLRPDSFERADLRAGDLLFFRGLGTAKVTHVGLATGEDNFIHASPYSGESSVVVEARVGNRYAPRFAGVGRLRDLVPARIQS